MVMQVGGRAYIPTVGNMTAGDTMSISQGPVGEPWYTQIGTLRFNNPTDYNQITQNAMQAAKGPAMYTPGGTLPNQPQQSIFGRFEDWKSQHPYLGNLAMGVVGNATGLGPILTGADMIYRMRNGNNPFSGLGSSLSNLFSGGNASGVGGTVGSGSAGLDQYLGGLSGMQGSGGVGDMSGGGPTYGIGQPLPPQQNPSTVVPGMANVPGMGQGMGTYVPQLTGGMWNQLAQQQAMTPYQGPATGLNTNTASVTPWPGIGGY